MLGTASQVPAVLIRKIQLLDAQEPHERTQQGLYSMAWVSSWVTELTLGGIAQYAGSIGENAKTHQ